MRSETDPLTKAIAWFDPIGAHAHAVGIPRRSLRIILGGGTHGPLLVVGAAGDDKHEPQAPMPHDWIIRRAVLESNPKGRRFAKRRGSRDGAARPARAFSRLEARRIRAARAPPDA
jgi:hypothetical protein